MELLLQGANVVQTGPPPRRGDMSICFLTFLLHVTAYLIFLAFLLKVEQQQMVFRFRRHRFQDRIIANYGTYIRLLDSSWKTATSNETSSDSEELSDTGPEFFCDGASPTSNSSSTRCPRDVKDNARPRGLHLKCPPLQKNCH